MASEVRKGGGGSEAEKKLCVFWVKLGALAQTPPRTAVVFTDPVHHGGNRKTLDVDWIQVKKEDDWFLQIWAEHSCPTEEEGSVHGTAARRPLLALNPRIPFSCQETGCGGVKRATKGQVIVLEVRRGGGSETEKKLLVFLTIRG